MSAAPTLIAAWRDTVKRGTPIEVRSPKWGTKRGRVLQPHGDGVDVELDAPGRSTMRTAFVFWKHIFPPPGALEERKPKALTATIVEQAPTLALAKAPSAPSAPPPPRNEKRPGPRARQSIHAHTLTPVGNAIRAARLAKRLTQRDAASLLGVSGSRLCAIELGDALPDEDLLLLVHEHLGAELDGLIEAWSETAFDHAPGSAAPGGAPAHEVRATEAETVAGSATSSRAETIDRDTFQRVAFLCIGLAELKKLPPEGPERDAWISAAFALWEGTRA